MDDGEQTAATTNDGDEQATIYHNIQSPATIRCTMALVSFSSARYLPRNRRSRFTLNDDER